MSLITCFSLVLTLMIINSVMGLFIGVDFYLLLLVILTLGFTVALILFDSKRIFSSKVSKYNVKGNTVRSVKKVQAQYKVRRKVS